jgi:hypothetical protein
MKHHRSRLWILLGAVAMALVAWRNLRTAIGLLYVSSGSIDREEAILPEEQQEEQQQQQQQEQPLPGPNNWNTATVAKATASTATAAATTSNTTSKILGFADYAYRDYAIRWYHRLESLGYQEQVIVAVDQAAADFFRDNYPSIRWEDLIPYKPCVTYQRDARRYRRQLFGRRWKYVLDQLKQGYHILLTDVDNVFSRYLPLHEFEDSAVDVLHAYSTSYPTYVFDDMGFTVCGGMSWLRAHPKVIRFVGTLVHRCGCVQDTPEQLCKDCECDDQVVLNELLWKGKHKVTWDRDIPKPKKGWADLQWKGISGISATTQHRIQIWDRNLAYRAPMPKTCPLDNWVSMPLYVNRSHVVQVWDDLCSNTQNKHPQGVN